MVLRSRRVEARLVRTEDLVRSRRVVRPRKKRLVQALLVALALAGALMTHCRSGAVIHGDNFV